jgi:hypothetical protein
MAKLRKRGRYVDDDVSLDVAEARSLLDAITDMREPSRDVPVATHRTSSPSTRHETSAPAR